MKIQYLGTAAAEGIPAIFCQCETCKKSRQLGGKNIRTRSQSIIDDKILIDLPADTYMHSIVNNIELSYIKTCLITHDHGDHLYPLEIANRRSGFAQMKSENVLTVYGTRPAYQKLMDIFIGTEMDEQNRVIVKKIKAFEPFMAEGYKITPLSANHSALCEPVIYIIEKEGKAILYGHDSGFFPEQTWEYLIKSGVKFSLVSLDCTFATKKDGVATFGGHMTLERNQVICEKLKELGLADENTVFVANHFTHNAEALHEEIEQEASKIGFLVSYDGMTVEF